MTYGNKKKIGRLTIEAERLSKDPKKKEFRTYSVKPVRYSWRVRIRAKLYYASRVFKLIRKHPRATLTLIRMFMKVKGNQVSTRVGISFLITVLGLFGVNVDPELFAGQVGSLIEGGMLVIGAVTSLYAIFKDEEKSNEKEESAGE